MRPILFIVWFLINSGALFANNHILKLGSKVEWAPYHIDTGEGADGLAVRALSCIMARMNQPYTIRKMPWARAQAMTKSGQLDGFFAASQNAERDSYAQQTAVFLPQVRRLYVLRKRGLVPVSGLDLNYAIANFTVAARHQSNALKTAEKLGFKILLTPQNANELMELLAAGGVHAVVENELVFDEKLRFAGFSQDEVHSLVIGQKNMGVYLGYQYLERHPRFIERFNAHVPACSLLKGE